MTAIRHIAGHGDAFIADVTEDNRLMVDNGELGIDGKIGSGDVFSAFWYDETVANNATVYFIIDANALADMHLFISTWNGAGPWTADIFEAVTLSAPGSAVASFNRDRRSNKTPRSTIRVGPTVTDEGTRIFGSLGGLQRGFTQSINREIIIDGGTAILFRISNKSGGESQVSVAFDWYETAI